jgi:hypothetical protein
MSENRDELKPFELRPGQHYKPQYVRDAERSAELDKLQQANMEKNSELAKWSERYPDAAQLHAEAVKKVRGL